MSTVLNVLYLIRVKRVRVISKHKTKKQSRVHSKPSHHETKQSHGRTHTKESRTNPHTHRHRSFIDDADARVTTSLYLGDDDDDIGDDQPPPLDGSNTEENQYSDEDAAGTVTAEVQPSS